MINHSRLDKIQLCIDDALSQLNDLPSEYDAVEYIRIDCEDIDFELSCLEEDDASDWISMIPDNLSAGEADSLRDAVNDWRVKNGYPRI
jgi:hypothetical protein